jgi:hypothetical protein
MEKRVDFTLNEATVGKLTSWKKEPSIQQLKGDLEAAKPAQQAQLARIDRWNDLMNVTGKARPKPVPGRSSVQPKLIRRQAEWRYSALTEPFLGSNKLFKVTPVTFEDDDGAKQNELVLNWQMRTKLNRVSFIDTYVRSTVDEGTSITRLGWKRVTVPIKEMVPVYEHYEIQDEQQLQLLQQAIELKQSNNREYDTTVDPAIKAAVDMYEEQGIPTYAVQVGEEERTIEKVLENRPTVEVMNPKNVFIDPSCGDDFDKALFVVISFETNKAELQKEGKRYKNLDKIDWQSNAPLMQPDHETRTPQDFQFKDAARKKVVAYEYWGFYDVEGNGKLVPFVATWIGDVLIRMEENPFPDEKLPFVVVPYLPIKRSLYGEPDAELLEDNQKILGAITRGMIDLLGRSANSQQGMPKGMLDVINKRRFENGQDYEYNPNANPNSGLIEHKYPELPQSALMMLNIQNQEAEALTGVKSFGGGMSGEAYGDVAAGIRGVLDAASKREMAILRRLAKGMTQIGQKLISMNAEFLSEEETIRVTNREFVVVKREDLKGNFDLETDISTIEVDNAKAQDLGFMLQTIGPNTDPSIVMMILAEIAELKRMPALAEKLRTFRPQPTPEQQELAKLEVEKARKEVEKLDSEIQLNLAKAEREKAEKDMANLNFVEQESGTNHAREMEKQAGQAKGNMDLEVTKALTKPRKLANGSESKPNIEAAVGFKSIADKLNDPSSNSMMTSPITRDIAAQSDPRLSISSQEYDPKLDPAMNPNFNI